MKTKLEQKIDDSYQMGYCAGYQAASEDSDRDKYGSDAQAVAVVALCTIAFFGSTLLSWWLWS